MEEVNAVFQQGHRAGGELGRVYLAQAYYFNNRPTIGRGKAGPVPAWSSTSH